MGLVIPNTIVNGADADGAELEQNFGAINQWANAEAITRDGGTAMIAPLLLPAAMPTTANMAASKAYVDSGVPIGSVTMYAGDTAPTNWLFCRGQAISRTTYATLFAAVGVRFGVGDGSTTFNLPNMQGTVPVGYNSGANQPANATGLFTAGVGERAGSPTSILVSHDHTFNHTHDTASHTHAITVTPVTNVHDMYSIAVAGGFPTSGDAGYTFGNPPNSGGMGSRLPVSSTALWNASLHTWTASASGSGILTTGAASPNQTNSAGTSAVEGNLQPSLSMNFCIKVL